MNVRRGAALVTAAVLLSGCGGNDRPVGREPTSEQDIGSTGAPSSSAPLRVGQAYKWPDGLQITVAKLRMTSPQQLDPTDFGKPKAWKGVLVDLVVTNGSSKTVKTDGPVQVTSDPSDSEGTLAAYEGPNSVAGAAWLGDAPLLPGRTRKVTSGIAVASGANVTLTIQPTYDYAETIWVGDVS